MTTLPIPFPLVTVPAEAGILSSYNRKGGTEGARADMQPLAGLSMNRIAADVLSAFLKLAEAVAAAGGDWRITDLFRDAAVQQAARQKYLNWVNAGKPAAGSATFNSKTMKAAFVAEVGKSFHMGGRALDYNIATLKFPNIAPDKQLDKLWEIAKPLGFSPVIEAPIEGKSESWHLDMRGELEGVYKRTDYGTAALVSSLICGNGASYQTYERLVQALLLRGGYAIGALDGLIGTKTAAAICEALHMEPNTVGHAVTEKRDFIILELAKLPAK